MIRNLMSLAFLLALLACKEEKISSSATACYSEFKGLRRGQHVVDVPVMVKRSNGLVAGKQLMLSNGVPLGACNLPDQFDQDSLAIYVSGYYLTSDQLELMNLTPLPFEVTSAKLR
jgi:hypothetical protein